MISVSAIFIIPGCASPDETERTDEPDDVIDADPDETFDILIATFEAEEAGFMVDGVVQFAEDLQEKTDGRVQVEFSFARALGEIPEYYDLVVQGVCDVSIAPTFMVPGQFPMADMTTLPFRFPSAEIATEAMHEMYKLGYLDDAYDEGVKVLFVSAGEEDVLFHVDKPGTSIADIQGERIIARGASTIAMVEAMGGSATFITGPEVYTALDRGTVEGQIVGKAAAPQWGWCEVIPYLTIPGQGTAKWGFFMNEDTYKSFPDDIQQIIDEMAADNRYGLIGARNLDRMAEEAFNCFKEQGGEVVEWEDEALEERHQFFEPIWEDWIAEREAMGLPAREAVEALYHILEDLGVENPAIGFTP